MLMRTVRQRGVAMLLALLTMVVVAGIGTLLFARTLNEMRHSRDDAAIVQTLLLARGGANIGGAVLAGQIRDELNAIVNIRSSTTTCWSFGTGSCTAERPTSSSVAADLTGANSVASQLQPRIDALLCNAPLDDLQEGATVTLRVYVTSTACGQPLPQGVTLPQGRFVRGQPRPADQVYAIPFVMVAEAQSSEYRRNVVLQGEYQFTVGRVTFAQYALFTNVHKAGAGGSAVWFTDNTLFDGPVHTNEYFRFYKNPWFGHQVTTAGCPDNQRATRINPSTGFLEEYCQNHVYGAYFHNAQTTLRQNLDANPSFGSNPVHAPELTGGVDWQAEFIPLPRNQFEQEQEAQRAGIHFGDNVSLSRLHIWAADANGNPLTLVNGEWAPRAVYQYVEAWECRRWASSSDMRCDSGGSNERYLGQWRIDSTGRIEYRSTSNGTWGPALNSLGQVIDRFNGVLYVDGRVARFGGPERTNANNANTAAPAIAHFAQMTLASSGAVRITRDIKYEDPPCSTPPVRNADGTVTRANCNDLDAVNVFGIYAQTANVLIGHNNTSSSYNAPDDVHIHGVLMSSEGMVTVEDYDQGNPRGSVYLTGGIIENYYGAFGTFNSSTGAPTHGYNRKFTYDPRMYSTVSPPYFPTIGLDKVKDVRVFSFGQREQAF